MKRLIRATKGLIAGTLALSLIGATAATAAPAYRGTPVQYRSDNYRHRGDDNGAAVAAGIGFIALAAILASQNNHRDYDRDGWSYRDQGRGYDNSYGGYDRGYGYGNGYGNYGRGYGNGYNNNYGNRGW